MPEISCEYRLNACSTSFVASKGSVGLKSKKLETEVKIKVEPVDDDVEMGELTATSNDFSLCNLFNLSNFSSQLGLSGELSAQRSAGYKSGAGV